jgi:hypothetical protein
MIRRRTFIKSASAVAIASTVSDAQQVPNSSGSERAKLQAPAGACDCHHHIYDAARFPPALALALEGLNSGESIEANEKYWEEKRSRLIERHRPTGAR